MLESSYREAPDGQPTSSIEHYLQHARSAVAEWEREVHFLTSRLTTATERVAREKDNIALYEWQLEKRLMREVMEG